MYVHPFDRSVIASNSHRNGYVMFCLAHQAGPMMTTMNSAIFGGAIPRRRLGTWLNYTGLMVFSYVHACDIRRPICKLSDLKLVYPLH